MIQANPPQNRCGHVAKASQEPEVATKNQLFSLYQPSYVGIIYIMPRIVQQSGANGATRTVEIPFAEFYLPQSVLWHHGILEEYQQQVKAAQLTSTCALRILHLLYLSTLPSQHGHFWPTSTGGPKKVQPPGLNVAA